MFTIISFVARQTTTCCIYLHFKLHHLETQDGKAWLAAFTSPEEYGRGGMATIISNFIDSYL